ncbi:MAG: RDD family protein [Pseudomonadota bacterium]
MSTSIAKRRSWLGRRLGAFVYDWMLIIALWFLCGAIVLALRGGELPPTNTSWFTGVLLAVPAFFYGWFWTHGGQTLGMRAWNIRLTEPQRGAVSAAGACRRLAAAIPSFALAGLGLLWTLIGPAHRSWHGYLSRTMVVFYDRRRAANEPATPQSP